MTDAAKSLWKAIFTEDIAGISSGVTNGADTESSVNDTALQMISMVRQVLTKREQPKTAEEEARTWDLVLNGLDRDIPKRDTLTPLLITLLCDFSEAAVALLSAGANPNHASAFGLTPLLAAVRRRNTSAAQALLVAGADPNHAMPYVLHQTQGHSPLVRAAGDGNLAIVQILLEHGADINKPNNAGRTALLTACARPSGMGWTDFQERHDLFDEAETEEGIASLISTSALLPGRLQATEEESVGEWDAIVDLLLERGADPEAEALSSSGNATIFLLETRGTPLLHAARRGDSSLVSRLLVAGATPRSTCGTTPLHAALQFGGDLETVRLLLQAGANPTERNQEKDSPVGNAIRAGALEGLQLLVEAGVDLFTRQPESGSTLLHSAAHSGQVEIARYLLDAGLEIDAVCSMTSPAEQQSQQDKLRTQVEQAMDKANEEVSGIGLPELPVHLLQPMGELDTERPTGITPLMLAAHANKAAMVQFLLERGADPKRRDSKSRSPRDYALRTKATEQRQRAFMDASRFNAMENSRIKDIMEEIHDESFRDNLTKQLEEMQSNFGAMMERILSGKRDAREETLALLPE